MTFTKTTLVERITEGMDIERSQARDAIETLLEIMKATLESGEDVMISGFGKFCVNEKAKRKGRNPATNSTMILPKRRVVTFKIAGVLRKRINGVMN